MLKTLLNFTNLHHFLMLDEGGNNEGEKIIRHVFKKLYIQFAWEDDCRQQIISAWLGAQYDPRKPRGEILAYATRAAFLAVYEWRRNTVVITTSPVRQSPEPIGISLDDLFGDELERFVDAINSEEFDPEHIAIKSEEKPSIDDEEARITPCMVNIPNTGRNSNKQEQRYRRVIDMLISGANHDEIAAEIGTTKRTVYRYITKIREHNEFETYTEAHKVLKDILRHD